MNFLMTIQILLNACQVTSTHDPLNDGRSLRALKVELNSQNLLPSIYVKCVGIVVN